MAIFEKKILKPGTYTVDRKDGTKSRIYIGPERLKRWVSTFNEMQQNGLQIPAPWRHDEKAQPVRLDQDVNDVDAYRNAGFWKKVWLTDEGHLHGQVDIPNRKDSGKVGKTVTEVSPLVSPNWEDGLGRSYRDCMTHIALVTHPVAPGQENFVEQGATALSLENLTYADKDVTIALANIDNDDLGAGHFTEAGNEGFDSQARGASGSVKTAVQVLRLLGLDLGDDTDESNIVERVSVAGRAVLVQKENADDTMQVPGMTSPTKRPKGSRAQEGAGAPTIGFAKDKRMSKEMEAALTFLEEKGVKKDDGSSYTVADIQARIPKPQETPLSKEHQAAVNFAQRQVVESYKERIKGLVKSGRVTMDQAKEDIVPLLQETKFSFDETGKINRTPLDIVLEGWEKIPENSLTPNAPQRMTVKKSGEDMFGQMQFSLDDAEVQEIDMNSPDAQLSETEANKLADSILEEGGVAHY